MKPRTTEVPAMRMPSDATGPSKNDPCIGCGSNDQGFCRLHKRWCHAAKAECGPKAPPEHAHTATRIICVETGNEYESIKAAARATGIPKTSIIYCLKGKMKAAKGFRWQRVDSVASS